nr:hypothetical protein GCM10025699_49640 [Microbacterium flavescens]
MASEVVLELAPGGMEQGIRPLGVVIVGQRFVDGHDHALDGEMPGHDLESADRTVEAHEADAVVELVVVRWKRGTSTRSGMPSR